MEFDPHVPYMARWHGDCSQIRIAGTDNMGSVKGKGGDARLHVFKCRWVMYR